MPLAVGTLAEQSMGVMTAMAGLIGACVAAYKLLKPSEPAPDEHREPVVDEEQEHIRDLREALAECRTTVRSLRGRLDRATQTSHQRGEPPSPSPRDWLSG